MRSMSYRRGVGDLFCPEVILVLSNTFACFEMGPTLRQEQGSVTPTLLGVIRPDSHPLTAPFLHTHTQDHE
jgi:hypothetical protein